MRLRFFAILIIFGMLLQLHAISAPEVIWAQQYSARQANSVIQTDEGDFICVGHKNGDQFGGSIYFLKTDNEGEVIWESDFPETPQNDTATELVQNDSMFVVTGYHESESFITKIYSNGDLIWFNHYSMEEIGMSRSLELDEDNNIIICGDNMSCFMMKTNFSGESQWIYNYLQSNQPEYGFFHDNKILANGDIAVIGYASYYVHPDHYWTENFLLTTNSMGEDPVYNILDFDDVCCFEQAQDGNLIIISEDKAFKIDLEGNTIWDIDVDFEAKSLIKDGEDFVVAGDESGNACLLKIDTDGNEIWSAAYDTALNDIIFDIAKTEDNGYILAGSSGSALSMIKLSAEIVSGGNEEVPVQNVQLSNYPNPFNPSTTISFELNTETTENTEVEIFNLKGQKVKSFSVISTGAINGGVERSQLSNIFSITWNGTDYNNNPVASGIYLYQLKVDGETRAARKCLLLK